MKAEPTVFDREDAYKEKIEENVRNIKALCEEEGIPFFASFATGETGEATKYRNHAFTPPACSVVLSDDRLRKYSLIANGSHDIMRKEDIMTVEFEC